ncbi:MAG: YebC/PmpR family DNA-binding transcriptional regulator [Pseudomonadota bacterium]
MAGHSKWANIQHRKGAQDKKRAKLFTKLGREIITAARLGGPDPDMNPRLRLAITKARKQSMPNDGIKKAIDKGAGGGEGENYEEIRYEGYGPNGVAIIVDALSDNRNRTVSELRTLFSKGGGNLGESGSVEFMFDRVGMILIPSAAADADTMFEVAVEAGASNCETTDEFHEITTEPDDYGEVSAKLEEKFGELNENSGLAWNPNTQSDVDEETAQKVLNLVEGLEDSDDVQSVTHNMNVSDEIMEKLLAS